MIAAKDARLREAAGGMTRTGVAAVDNLAACLNVVPIRGFHGIEEEFRRSTDLPALR